ncbi:MAG: RagB/SusD family nutrient uptake outer membrane protein [Gemmatimonadetes bacterium]|nr:RagB/SusD family nutrient uptake outer membrane protein [Gemmatimonadota bacterium]
MRPRRERGSDRRRRGAGGLVFAALLPLAGCDFSVTNPGPVQDQFLDQPAAYAGVVAGMNRAFNDAWGEISRRGASAAREIFPSGNTGYWGITETERRGLLLPDVTGDRWEEVQNARWVAEDGLRRFGQVLTSDQLGSSEVVGRGYLWAGYGNRLLGEHFCDAVIDGGPLQQGPRAFYERAEQHFTKALEIFTKIGKSDLANAARSGRASARVGLRKWADAVADAKPILDSFRFRTNFSDVEQAQYNPWWWTTARQPFRGHTTWNTFYENYFKDTGDPRTPYTTDPKFPTGDQPIPGFGQVPFLIQTKYPAAASPANLSSGREMRLIEAEALLVAGKWQEAMAVINALRSSVISTKTGKALEPWTATNVVEAWTVFKREHGIELWLEGRRLGARRRWADDKTPGALDPHEIPSAQTYLAPDSHLCYPVALTEFETNPNLRK